jgi:hypothetical protein
MALQSTADLRLLNRLFLFFDLALQFEIFHLLTSVCIQLHHLLFGHPLSQLPWGLLLNIWLTFLLLPGHFIPKEMAKFNYLTEGWVGPAPVLTWRQINPLSYQESNLIIHAKTSHLLTKISHPLPSPYHGFKCSSLTHTNTERWIWIHNLF